MKIVRWFLVGLATVACCGLPVLADWPGADSAPPALPGATYFEENHPSVAWSGSWSTNPLAANSGGSARLAMDPGAEASFVFAGSSVSWIGYRDEWCGIASVFLDGVLQATVDTYSIPARARATLYTISGLERGTHTLTIQTTGTHNSASAGSWVWVDAFSVSQAWAPGLAASPRFIPAEAPSAGRAGGASRAASASRVRRSEDAMPAGGVARFDQDDAAVSWSGAWSSNQLTAHSGGSARLSMEAASRVSLVFRGTGVSWIGYRDEWSGIADVLLDGRLRASVDTYSKPARAQATLFALDGLPDGAHTLTIQVTGGRRPASGGSWIWVDAFSITP